MTKQERHEYVRIAKQLGYSNDVIDKLKNAKTDYECATIMHAARLAKR